MKIFSCYLLIVNALAFSLMLMDKKKAKNRQRRIPERVLLRICAIGGSIGGLMGMYLLRHKTKHPRFALGIPAMLMIHAVILFFVHCFLF